MRQGLKPLNGVRRRFTGTFVRTGAKHGWKGRIETTVLLKDIKDALGKIVCDHLWFNLTKEFDHLNLKEGVTVAFDARVKSYLKGYRGYREDVCMEKPCEMDFKLSHPTKVQIVPYSAEYAAGVRKMQDDLNKLHNDMFSGKLTEEDIKKRVRKIIAKPIQSTLADVPL